RAVEPGSEFPAVELKAPIAGVITALHATVGPHVQTTEARFTLLNTDTVFIEAQLPEADLGRLGPSQGATYETPAAPGTLVSLLGAGGVPLSVRRAPRRVKAGYLRDSGGPRHVRAHPGCGRRPSHLPRDHRRCQTPDGTAGL